MSILPAEAFFSSAVLLVEGPSELLFYRALSRAIDVDLDRLNISIVSVDGIGFDVYCSLLTALSIPFAVRTDNDIFKIPKTEGYRYAGVIRGVDIGKAYRRDFDTNGVGDLELLRGFPDRHQIPADSQAVALSMRALLAQYGIFVAQTDLEHDLYAAHPAAVLAYTGEQDSESAIESMKSAKANFMFGFLQQHSASLSGLTGTELAAPLTYCQQLVLG
jgi:putative ATP-dependent endonuclease of OLD family